MHYKQPRTEDGKLEILRNDEMHDVFFLDKDSLCSSCSKTLFFPPHTYITHNDSYWDYANGMHIHSFLTLI